MITGNFFYLVSRSQYCAHLETEDKTQKFVEDIRKKDCLQSPQ